MTSLDPRPDRPSSPSPAADVPRDAGRRRLLAAGAVAGAATALGAGPLVTAAAASSSADANADARREDPRPQGSGFYRFSVGSLDVALVGDGGWVGTAAAYGTNVTAEQRAAACRDAFLDPEAVPGGVHCLLVRHPGGTVLVDVGCGSVMGPGAGRLVAHLDGLGLTPADIDAIVITHLHPDHIGGLLGERGAAMFPNATFHVSEVEASFWADSPSLARAGVDAGMKDAMRGAASGALAAIDGRVERFAAGAELLPGVRTLDLPGHTPGHTGLQLDDGGRTLVFIADVLHNAPMQLPNPGWHVAFDVDSVQAAATRGRLLDRAATERLLLCGSHLPFPALGHVARDGAGGYRWVPEIWRWDA
jgi:glyoxylase-like metal-dependent hydrolase (beta-lactamase superfamily II)